MFFEKRNVVYIIAASRGFLLGSGIGRDQTTTKRQEQKHADKR
jgi:hypothetical protein